MTIKLVIYYAIYDFNVLEHYKYLYEVTIKEKNDRFLLKNSIVYNDQANNTKYYYFDSIYEISEFISNTYNESYIGLHDFVLEIHGHNYDKRYHKRLDDNAEYFIFQKIEKALNKFWLKINN